MRRHDQLGQRQCVRRAAHILFHQAHARRRLDIQPARVESNPLADNRNAWVARIAPLKLNKTRRMFAHCRLANRVNERIAGFQRLTRSHRNLCLMRFCDPFCLYLQRVRPKVPRWPVHKVAHQCRRGCLQRGHGNARRLLHQQNPWPCQLWFAQIFMVAILPQHPAKHSLARIIIGQPICTFGQAIRQLCQMP